MVLRVGWRCLGLKYCRNSLSPWKETFYLIYSVACLNIHSLSSPLHPYPLSMDQRIFFCFLSSPFAIFFVVYLSSSPCKTFFCLLVLVLRVRLKHQFPAFYSGHEQPVSHHLGKEAMYLALDVFFFFKVSQVDQFMRRAKLRNKFK